MNIKRYLEFINESRSQRIKSDKTYIEIIEEYAPWYLTSDMKDIPIYRGLKSDNDFLLVDSNEYKRTPLGDESSINKTPLYYDTIMNSSKNWLDFSNGILRNNSIFTSNSPSATNRYGSYIGGNTYRVIPLKESSEFIMGFGNDAYRSFNYINKRFGLEMMGFSRILKTSLKLKSNYSSLDEMRKDVDAKDGNMNDLIESLYFKNLNFNRDYDDRLTKGEIKSDGGLMNWIEKMFDPNKNQFELIKYDKDTDFHRNNMYNNENESIFELWTNKPCLLIKDEFFS